MHPAVTLILSVFLRVGCLILGGFRLFAVSLSGGGDLLIPQLPAFALLYFAIAPKPRAGQRIYVAVATAVFLLGVIPTAFDLAAGAETGFVFHVAEILLLALSIASHVAHALWKDRDPHLGWLQYL